MNTDSLIIDIQSTSKDSTKNIDSLVESLENLSKALSDVISQSNSFKNLKNITSGVKTSTRVNKQSIQTPNRDKQLEKLGVGDFNSLQKGLISETTSYDKVISKYKDELGRTVIITEKATSAGQKFNVVLKQTHPQVKTLSEQLKDAQNVMGKVQAKMVALGASLIGMVKKAVDFVDRASAESEALNLFTVSMGEYAEEGTRWLEKFSNALYLDPVSVQQYMGSFNSLVKGLGVGSENAYKMSKNLTQLVYDLSSFKNISIESSYEKLMSGISGELEPLRNVGVAMSEATLQTLAYDLGIEKMVRNMTEAEKAQLRYIQIMRSSTEWQTDMGRTLITPANALRVLRQQFVQLGRAIGKVFIPIIMSAMPYVIAITQMLTALAQKLANFLGYEIADIDYSGLGDISAGITDIGTSADKTAEKLNTMLAPFDDLNVVQNQAKNASSGLGGIGGDLGVELPEYDALAELNEEFGKNVDDARKKLETLIPVIKEVAIALASVWVTNKIAKFVNSLLTIHTVLKNIARSAIFTKFTKFIKSIPIFTALSESIKGIGLGISTWITGGATFGEMISFILPYLGTFAQIIGGISATLLGITRTISGIKKVIQGDTFKGILQTIEGIALVVAGIALLLGGWVVAIVAGVIAGVALVIEYWSEIKTFFGDLWGNIKDGFNTLWLNIVEIFTPVVDWFSTNVIQPIMNRFSPIINWFSQLFGSIWQTVKDIWGNITGFITGVVEIIQVAWDIFVPYFDSIITPVKEFFSGLWEGMKIGAKMAWEGIKSVFSTVADFFRTTFETAWKAVKMVFSVGGKIFNGIKDGIVNAFRTVVNAIITGINKVVAVPFNKINEALKKIKNVEILGITPFKNKITTINVPQIPLFEQGGYPPSGELFFANENGVPELIGSIGNKTAVANNDQITTSITNALVSALNQYDFGGGNSPTTIYIGTKKVFEGYGDYVADENDRYGTNMIRI